jgi:GNAT superfamily N-acetyltransferase
MLIRPVEPERDADACTALQRETAPHSVSSRATWLHRTLSLPARAERTGFVAEVDGRVVGDSYGFLGLFGDDSVAVCGVAVTAAHRRRGIGAALLDAVDERFRRNLLARFEESEAGTAFAAAHGFHQVRAETESSLDLQTCLERPDASLDIRPISAIDPHDAHLVDLEATHDMPSTEKVDDLSYEDWAELVLRYPLFAADGSFVLYADGEAAAISLLVADFETGRTRNWFTGTRRAFRGRGLGRAVKIASIAWARGQGLREMSTENDETNAPMLAINRALGFRPSGRRVEWLRER